MNVKDFITHLVWTLIFAGLSFVGFNLFVATFPTYVEFAGVILYGVAGTAMILVVALLVGLALASLFSAVKTLFTKKELDDQ